MDYAQLLKKARDGLPKDSSSAARFEIPNVRGHVQGNKTVISNFNQIAASFRRPVEHLLKYILKELASPGEMKKSGAVIIGTKVPASRINDKIKQYAQEFVLCKECGKPDTKTTKEGAVMFLKCQACGARHPVKSKI